MRSILHSLNELFDPVPSRIIYCYGEYQHAFKDMIQTIPNIYFNEGFPDNLYGILEGYQNSLVIIEDLMSECSKDQRISDLFTRGSHHQGISVMYLTQNLFPPGKQSRTISLNSHYMIVFKNPRDSLGVSTLARQMYPNNCNFLRISPHCHSIFEVTAIVLGAKEITARLLPTVKNMPFSVLEDNTGFPCKHSIFLNVSIAATATVL